MLTLNDGRSELWQWDTNRKLTVDADCSQVHFSNKVFGRSIDVDVADGVAIIPDILLQTDKDLTAWAFVGTPENGYTKISKVFKVNKRNKPADYVFTPPEQTTLEEIKEKLDYLESIQDPDAIKNAVEDYLEQNPVESPVQSVNGKTGKVDLTAEDVGAISQDKLQEATNEALAQAKASGEFDGADGYTPQKNVDYFDGKDGYTPQKGKDYFDGDDYVLTPADKTEIAEMAAELVEVPEGSGGIAVTGATVGQTVKISAVDENGVPTAWVPTDFPSGGGSGGEEWVEFCSGYLTEPVSTISIRPDAQGVKELLVYGNFYMSGDTKCRLEINGRWTAGKYTESGMLGKWNAPFVYRQYFDEKNTTVHDFWIVNGSVSSRVSTDQFVFNSFPGVDFDAVVDGATFATNTSVFAYYKR